MATQIIYTFHRKINLVRKAPCSPDLLNYLIPMNLAWDRVKSDTEIIIREMLFEDPRKVVKKHGKEKLRKIFLKYIRRFDKVNGSFWSLILEVNDEELTKASASNFREAFKIWNY